jgi:glyoxylase I family protein
MNSAALKEIKTERMVGPHSRLGSINHLRITVTNIPRAEGFYDPLLRKLGYRLVERSGTRLAWAGWASHGILHWFIMSVAAFEHLEARHDRHAPGFHHVAFNVDSREEVDDFHRLLLARGATVLDAPAEYDYEPGYYAVFFADPDGLKLEVMHVPTDSSEAYWTAFLARGAPLAPASSATQAKGSCC